ncbi:isoleucine--tRNA ligase [Alterisphingorhabdus coralli]|uniref:Isoleucine--tRNA ligase n=1 Tax=Alterisphingorhabdus coralli TaxID=3071408 RepID=A0AA97F722_9SPHN|nr:isoleucine--tRNA ligase [Parasphingorhabdus sp. SCSIO 66989]WOE75599.1 isoleucine--tRNA ligase [Parasphingorhabdus sp. SCSIO 66989]
MTDSNAPEKPDYKDTVFLPKTPFPMKAGLANKEPGILDRWRDEKLYETLRERRKGRETFILHDGPPYANGDIHIGHSLNKILKDLVVRTQSLLGKDAPYVPGWDCHGLPIEWKIEEQYRKKKRNKDEVPASEFRAECRDYADKWVNVQRGQFQRLGVMGRWDQPYLTMDYAAEAEIVAELLKFAESGQLYRGAKPVMWSPVEKTALAEAEVEYEDITSTQIDVAFEIVEAPNCPEIQELIDKGEKVHAAIWTTTPWTIPVNQALAYGEEVDYCLYQINLDVGRGAGGHSDATSVLQALAETPIAQGRRLLIASALAESVSKRLERMAAVLLPPGLKEADLTVELSPVSLGGTYDIKGSQLAGAIAQHPMADHFSSPLAGEERDLARNEPSRSGEGSAARSDESFGAQTRADPSPQPSPARGEGALVDFFTKPRPFLPGDFVTTDAGTGLVHMAPDHGEDDFDLCKSHGINPVFAVDSDGQYREDWAWLPRSGSVINKKFVAVDGPICNDLREAGALLSASDDFAHSYPHSWRSKAKIIYRCTPQWFVPMDSDLTHLPAKSLQEKGWEDEGGAVDMNDETLCASPTLREVALDEIRNKIRFVPERGQRRLESMVEGRPDWVLSRQRAWGVPIALYVNRKSGEYLNDPAVNERIIAAFRQGGADAWFEADHQALLGNSYDLADYEVITDILDVWFDSGSTHAFVLESERWPELDSPADLYLEGSDQHRGWFQSSLLESGGTRGRAPYKALLTHGMTLDKNGKKMSKSLGNTLDPQKVINVQGADILRLWAASVDFTEDHRIGDEILKTVSDSYRKLRNTFRYMLGGLSDFDEAEKMPVADMPELERYMLHRLAALDAELKQAVNDFAFGKYVRALSDFANEDLSAFFFDIRKDCLYCDVNPETGTQTDKRRAYRTVLDVMFHAMTRYIAPVLCFTAEEVWQTRYPDADSVHLLEWPEVDARWADNDLAAKWDRLRDQREAVTEAIEPLRQEKTIRSSLEAEIVFPHEDLAVSPEDFAEICIIAGVADGKELSVTKTTNHKCGRCWRLIPDVAFDGGLCDRCSSVLNG